MAKRKRSTQTVDTPDAVFSAVADAVEKNLEITGALGVEAEAGDVGLYLPALSLRYLFSRNVMLLSRIMQIIGEEGTAKSALFFEIMRWHLMVGGVGTVLNNENKDAPEVRNGLLGYDPKYVQRVRTYDTRNMEGWQDIMTKMIAAFDAAVAGGGRWFPLIIGVDSIMATACLDEIENVQKLGHAKRGHAVEALLISRYMRTMPDRLNRRPVTIVGTNHAKPGTDNQGRPVLSIPGGKSLKFMETYEIHTRWAYSGHDIDRADYQGLRVQLQMKKNSAGPSRRKITVNFIWWSDPQARAAGLPDRRCLWDWHTATIELLLSFEKAPGKKTLYDNLRDLTGIRAVAGKRAYSEILGMPKDSPKSYHEIGRLLEERTDLHPQLHQLLDISSSLVLREGDDYSALVAQSQEAAKDRAAKVAATAYEGAELLPSLVPVALPGIAAEFGEEDDSLLPRGNDDA